MKNKNRATSLKILKGKSTLKPNSSAYENMNMEISVVGTSNKLLIRGSYAETKFKKKKINNTVF